MLTESASDGGGTSGACSEILAFVQISNPPYGTSLKSEKDESFQNIREILKIQKIWNCGCETYLAPDRYSFGNN